MTTVTKKTTRVSEAQGRFIDQFKAHTNIDGLTDAIVQQNQDLENAAFEVLEETTAATAVGVQLDGLGQIVGEERQGRSDADYRIALLAKVLLNNGSGTIEDIAAIVDSMAGGGATIILSESYPASFEVTVDTVITNGTEIGSLVVRAKAGGVGISFRWFESLPEFRFDTAGQGFDQGKMGAAAAA